MNRAHLSDLVDRAAAALRHRPLPRSRLGARAALTAHVVARAWSRRAEPNALPRAVLALGLAQGALSIFGRGAVLDAGSALFPLFVLPDLHGPYFDEALQRLLLPGRGPFAVHLAVTGRCASRCRYCYAEAGGASAPDLGDARLLAAADALVAADVPLVILGGGAGAALLGRGRARHRGDRRGQPRDLGLGRAG